MCVHCLLPTRVKHKAIQLSTWPRGVSQIDREGTIDRWTEGRNRSAEERKREERESESCSLRVKGEDSERERKAVDGRITLSRWQRKSSTSTTSRVKVIWKRCDWGHSPLTCGSKHTKTFIFLSSCQSVVFLYLWGYSWGDEDTSIELLYHVNMTERLRETQSLLSFPSHIHIDSHTANPSTAGRH